MPRPHPYIMFFGDAVQADMEIAFLRESVESLERLLAEAAKRPYHPPLNDVVAALAGDRETLYGEILPQVIYETHAISCVVLLERICRDFVKELAYALPSTLTMNDLSGTVLERFRTYCGKVANLTFGLSQDDWRLIHGLVAIRNTLIHSSGIVENSRDSRLVENFASQHGTPEIVDGRLRFSRSTSELYLGALSNFVDKIFNAALARFPEEA